MGGGGHDVLHGGGLGPLALNALERLRAAGDWSPMSGSGWLLMFLVATIVLAAIVAAAVVLRRRRVTARLQSQAYERQAQEMGLSEAERHVLTALVRSAKLHNPAAVFTAATAFERGAAALMRSPRVTAMSPQRQQNIQGLIDSLRSKLLFDRPAAEEGAAAEPEGPDIRQGDRLMVVHRGEASTFDVNVAACGPDELIVELPAPLEYRLDETWLVRYTKEGQLWEFDAPILRGEAGKVVLGRTERPRFINRRRFPRVRTRKPVQLATFPFARSDLGPSRNDFVPGELVEIGGTGLRVEAPVQAKPGERVLIAMEFGPGDVVESIGKVRRVDRQQGQDASLVVELLGLSSEEVSKLTHETNLAAHDSAAAEAEEPPAEPQGPEASPGPQES
jgi:hypothetical protein